MGLTLYFPLFPYWTLGLSISWYSHLMDRPWIFFPNLEFIQLSDKHFLSQWSIIVVRCSNSSVIYFFFWSIFSILLSLQLLLLLQDGSLLAATINGFPLSTAKITEKRKIIEEIALADVKKVRHYFSHHRSSFVTILLYIYIQSNLVIVNFFCSQQNCLLLPGCSSYLAVPYHQVWLYYLPVALLMIFLSPF